MIWKMLINYFNSNHKVTLYTTLEFKRLLISYYEERENFLLKLHEAEMQAIISTQATQTNENLDIILRLEKENDLLRTSFKSDDTLKPVRSQQLPNSAPINNISNISNTSYMCDTADVSLFFLITSR